MKPSEAETKIQERILYLCNRRVEEKPVKLVECGSCREEFYTWHQPDFCACCGVRFRRVFDTLIADAEVD